MTDWVAYIVHYIYNNNRPADAGSVVRAVFWRPSVVNITLCALTFIYLRGNLDRWYTYYIFSTFDPPPFFHFSTFPLDAGEMGMFHFFLFSFDFEVENMRSREPEKLLRTAQIEKHAHWLGVNFAAQN